MAIAALVLGLVSLVFCWTSWFSMICGILAIIFAIIALKKAKKEETPKGKGMSIAGMVTGIIGFIIALIITIAALLAAKAIKKGFEDAVNKVDWNQVGEEYASSISSMFEIEE